MYDQAAGDDIRILVMDKLTLAANIACVTIALRHLMTYVVRSTLCAKMYYHGCCTNPKGDYATHSRSVRLRGKASERRCSHLQQVWITPSM